MNLERLPSGSYRVRMTFNGKRQSVVFDHKPTENEVMLKFSEKINTIIDCKHITFEIAAKEYCKLKQNVLSPTTYREYTKTCNRLSDEFKTLYIDQITALNIQHEVNTLSADKKPKTVRNYYGFIMSVIRTFRENFNPKITLPQKEMKEVYIPSDDIMKKLFAESQVRCSGRYYIPIILGCYGMRRSEICALTIDDIQDNMVHITKSKVMNVDNEWIIKKYLKNDTSFRIIPISEDIANQIIKQGYVYEGHPNDITGFINDFCKENNIPIFSLHKLRHYFCSRLSSENIDTETIMALGGWKTDYVLNSIYRHKVDSKVQEASNKLTSILF